MSKEANTPAEEGKNNGLNDNDESTVRLNQNEDSTVRLNTDNEATIRIDADDDSTVRISTDDDATVMINNEDDSTVRVNNLDDVAQNANFPQNAIVLNGVEYRIDRTISESTGEARIELLNRNNELSVLKLYFSSVRPKLELVDKLKGLVHQNIIKVFEYGFYNSDSGEQRFFERMEYAQGGTAEEFMPTKDVDFIKRIIANVTEGLDYIHKKGIIHRDIKPGNLFFRDKEQTELVISDFGISSLKSKEEDVHQTVNKAFTKFYSAPETLTIEDKITIEPKLDFYSLGLTILRMWHGKNLYKGIPDHIITTMKFDNKLLDSNFIDDAFPREFLSLVRGLTLVSRENRWGASEVRKWLSGELVDIVNDLTSIEPRRPFEGLIANSTKELAQMLVSHKELGIKYLYRGKISDWLKESDPKTQTLIDDIVEDQYKDDKNAGLQAAVYLLDKDFPYYDINGKACADHIEISYSLENNRKEYHRRLQNKSDNFYIYWRAQNNAKFAEYCYNVISDSKTPAELSILKIVYSINPDFPFPLGQGGEKQLIQSPNELIPYVKENGNLNIIKALDDGSLLTWFESLEEFNDVAKAVRNAQAKTFSSEWIISIISYYVDKDAGYYGYKNAPAKVYSKEDLAIHLAEYAEFYSQMLKKGDDIPLFDYMIARGWGNHIGLFKKVMQATGYDYAPLTDDLRFAIMARDLVSNVPYVFQNGITVTSIEELQDKITDVQHEVANLLDNDDAKFCAWLQAQFHYKLDYKHSNTTEFKKRLKEYFEYRSEIFKKDKKLKLYSKALLYTDNFYKNINKRKQLILLFLIVGLLTFTFCLKKMFYWLKESNIPLEEFDSSYSVQIKVMIGITIALSLLYVFFYFKRFRPSIDIESHLKKNDVEKTKYDIAISYAAENGRNSIRKYFDKNVLTYGRKQIVRIVTYILIFILITLNTYGLWKVMPPENRFFIKYKHLAQITNTSKFDNLVNSLSNKGVYISHPDKGYIRFIFKGVTIDNILKFEVIRDYRHNINRDDKPFGYYDENTGEIKLTSTNWKGGEYTLNISDDYNNLECSMDKSILDHFYLKEKSITFKPSNFYRNSWAANCTFLGKQCEVILKNDRSLTLEFPSNLVGKYRSKLDSNIFAYNGAYYFEGEGDFKDNLKLTSVELTAHSINTYNTVLKNAIKNDSELKSQVEAREKLDINKILFDLVPSKDGKSLNGTMYLVGIRDKIKSNTTAVTFKQVK